MTYVGLLEQGKFRSHSHYVSERQKARYFYKVAEAYVATRELSPLVAIDYDPEARARKLSADAIHYIADIELATKKALGTSDLFRQWQRLISEQTVERATATRIVSRCGEEYMRRKLTPSQYFVHIKTRPERRKAAA